jgi:predicted RNA-binding protein YlxR (DUF448 family)
MSISNSLEEISTCIACPKCRRKSSKDWVISRFETKGKPKVRKSRAYFICFSCNYLTEIFDKKLLNFIVSELLENNDLEDDYKNNKFDR